MLRVYMCMGMCFVGQVSLHCLIAVSITFIPPSPLPSTPHLPSSVVLRVWEDAKVQVAYGSSPPEDVATTKQLTPISDLLKTAMELQTKTTKVCKEVLNVFFFLQMSTPFSSFLHHLCLFWRSHICIRLLKAKPAWLKLWRTPLSSRTNSSTQRLKS